MSSILGGISGAEDHYEQQQAEYEAAVASAGHDYIIGNVVWAEDGSTVSFDSMVCSNICAERKPYLFEIGGTTDCSGSFGFWGCFWRSYGNEHQGKTISQKITSFFGISFFLEKIQKIMYNLIKEEFQITGEIK
jgi:hypothetical protein